MPDAKALFCAAVTTSAKVLPLAAAFCNWICTVSPVAKPIPALLSVTSCFKVRDKEPVADLTCAIPALAILPRSTPLANKLAKSLLLAERLKVAPAPPGPLKWNALLVLPIDRIFCTCASVNLSLDAKLTLIWLPTPGE